MRSYVFLSRSEFTSSDLASFLEEVYDGAWFAEFQRATIETIGGTVFLDYLGDCVETRIEPLTESEVSLVTAYLGARPKIMIVLGISSHYLDSDKLAEEVVRNLQNRWGGVVFDGDRVTNDLSELLLDESIRIWELYFARGGLMG